MQTQLVLYCDRKKVTIGLLYFLFVIKNGDYQNLFETVHYNYKTF
jgi:hypothetical protein